MVALAFSLFVLLRPPVSTLEKDVKATVRRLERDWEDAQERLAAASGRAAKQRGLLERAKQPVTPVAVDHGRDAGPDHLSRSDILRGWRVKNAKQDSAGPREPRGPDLRSTSEAGGEGRSGTDQDG